MGGYVKKKKKFNFAEFFFLCVILAVPIIHFLVFWLYVNFDSILMAFQYKKGGQVLWGFENYVKLFNLTGIVLSITIGLIYTLGAETFFGFFF